MFIEWQKYRTARYKPDSAEGNNSSDILKSIDITCFDLYVYITFNLLYATVNG